MLIIFQILKKHSQEAVAQTDRPPATSLKKRLWHRCFPVNFAKFLRTLFSYRTPLVAASDCLLYVSNTHVSIDVFQKLFDIEINILQISVKELSFSETAVRVQLY